MTRTLIQTARCVGLLLALHCLACSSDDDDAGTAGTGTAGQTARAGVGGAAAGAGTVAGAAGAVAGSGGAEGIPDCTGAKTGSAAALHTAAAEVLLPGASNRCAFSSCHSSGQKKAGLALEDPTLNLHDVLADKPACEAPNLKLVDSSGGAAGLANSWLWLKLTAPADASTAELEPDSAWGEAGSCDQRGSDYGTRMPQMGSAETLDQAKLAAVRDWICAGAPGPS